MEFGLAPTERSNLLRRYITMGKRIVIALGGNALGNNLPMSS